MKSVIVATILLFPCIANANSIDPNKKNLSTGECVEIFDALSPGLDGRIIGDKKIVFKFSLEIRTAIRKNIQILRPIRDLYQDISNDLINGYSGGKGEIKSGSPESVEFLKADKTARAAPCNVDLLPIHIKDSDLEGEANQYIPSSVLAVLAPILPDLNGK